MQTKNNEMIIDAIEGGLQHFYLLARTNIRAQWKKLSTKDRYQIGRALVALDDLAKNPKKYLASKDAMKKIEERVDAAFWTDWKTRAHFGNFCLYVNEWYATSRDADKIVKVAKDIKRRADIAQDGRIEYWLMHSKLKEIMLPKPYDVER